MAEEVWYRGEVIGVTPSTPGSTPPHDLGDGMYLTDSEESAKEYAELRLKEKGLKDPSKRRVFSVKINRSSLRILDLTTDLRWQEHIKPVEPILRTGTANENYGRTFKNFVRIYKIDLNQYDAVIGYDYVRGGLQICILYKNGKPTRIHTAIRKMFKLIDPIAVRVQSSIPRINIRSKPVKKVVGVTAKGIPILSGLAIDIFLGLIETWLTKKTIEKNIRNELDNLKPKITEEVDKIKTTIAKQQLLLDKGGNLFANITIEIHWIKKSLGPGKPSYIDPDVRFKDINVTNHNIKAERAYEHDERGCQKVDQYIESFEVGIFTSQELELFRDLQDEYLYYKRKLRMDPANLVLIEETRRLRQMILSIFEVDVWLLDPGI